MNSSVITADFVEALRAKDRDRVNDAAARLFDQQGRLGVQWFDIAKVLLANLEVGLALNAADRGLQETGGSAAARFRYADILAGVGRHSAAIEMLTRGQPTAANALQVDQFVGMCALETGDVDRAREALDRVVGRWAGAGAAWLSLSALPAKDDEILLARLRGAEAPIKVGNALYRAQWHYALGNVLDRLDKVDEAFAQFAAGAAIMKDLRPYDAVADRAEAEQALAVGSGVASGPASLDSNRAILVTGLPRSGTTLVEHILSGHPDVAGGDELPFGGLIVREATGMSPGGEEAARLAAMYLHFGDERFGFGLRFIDKSIDASRHIGLLASILPDAPIVWLRRDALNCAWSCFRTCFAEGISWSWSLEDIAAHFQAEDRLYEHWSKVLGKRLLTINYEEFVAYSEAGTRRLFGHVGLKPDAAGPASHEIERAVTTASALQVRQPIYQSAINAADRYRHHLEPFIAAYGKRA
jgi:tetratricopeptide (TPR) repeat protein